MEDAMRTIERSMTRAGWLVALLAVAACGGSKPATRTAAAGGGGEGGGDTAGDDGDDPSMVGVERLDEIKQSLDRKRTAAARCLADVVNAGKVEKNSRGHLALGFVITAAGKPTGIKVLEDSLASPDLEQCVIAK